MKEQDGKKEVKWTKVGRTDGGTKKEERDREDMEERRYYLETWWKDERGMGRRRKIKG